jgi:hypothetical protein
MSEVQPSTADATVPSYRSIQRTTDTEAAVVDLDTQANSRSQSTTPIAQLNEGEGSVSNVGEEAIAVLPTDEPESTISRSSGVDSNLTEDLTPELLAQVQRAIAPAIATSPLHTLVRYTEQKVLNDAVQAVLDYRKTHAITNPVGLLITAIRQQWQPQQRDGYAASGHTTPPEFNAWFNWARSRGWSSLVSRLKERYMFIQRMDLATLTQSLPSPTPLKLIANTRNKVH